MTGSVNLTLSAPQALFLKSPAKIKAFVGGFGSGKTFVGGLDTFSFLSANPKTLQGYFAPTYRDIRDTYWPTMHEVGELLGYKVKEKTADRELQIYRGKVYYGTVICRSMDSPDSIVGFKMARGHVDEIDVMALKKAENAFRKIMARLRLVIPGVKNCLTVTSTPEGYKFVYDKFAKDPKPGYYMVQASTYENIDHLPEDYIQSLLNDYPPELVNAYLMGMFVNLTSGTVYRHFDRKANRSCESIRLGSLTEKGETLFIGQDFNVGKMSSIVFVQRSNGYHAVGEHLGLKDTPALIETLRTTYPHNEIRIYPDASGNNRSSTDASKSDLSLLRSAGYVVKARSANPPVRDRVLAVNSGFMNKRLWVNEDLCPRYTQALEQQAYNNNGEPDKEDLNEHPNDAAGYFVYSVMPVKKPVSTIRELVH